MPTLIMTKLEGNIDGSVKAKAMSFLQKLAADDTVPGLHIEPIHGAADPRVRTGRVDQFWRAVLFRLDSDGERHYLVHGVWAHDEASKIARRLRLRVNPVNGLPQFEQVPDETPAARPAGDAGASASRPAVPAADTATAPSLLVSLGRTREDLVDRLGIPDDIAERALAAPDENALLMQATDHEGWIGMLLVDLATSDPIEHIALSLELTTPAESDLEADSAMLESLKRPAARVQFAFIAGQDELRRVIEAGDLGAWRVFLHPTQRGFVDRNYNGPGKVTGGAGTGKTVVLVHRARRLATQDAAARVLLTTFTTNLADSLGELVIGLDPRMQLKPQLGDAGIHIAGIDAIASTVIRNARSEIDRAVEAVLGETRSAVTSRTPSDRWRDILDTASHSLASEIANETFLRAEYALIVLPNHVTSEADYLHIRRPGRGLALDRAKRTQVWSLIAAYRAQGRIDGSIDFTEAAAIAARYLDENPAQRPADHVLVDEAQDLTPAQLQLVRALAPSGPNDLFLAEDSHQRIYGPRTVLSRYGIEVRGRSRRLTLNYRTTAQNLQYAMALLDGADYVDLDGEPESTGYRSARSGPAPQVLNLDSLEAELTAIVDHVRRWVDGGTSLEAIAVLTPDRYQRDRVTNRLAESSLAARAVDRGVAPTDRIAVMTMHRAKGMEFAKVIITDVGYRSPNEQARLDAIDHSERADAELRHRSLQYVASTRARDELVVLRRS